MDEIEEFDNLKTKVLKYVLYKKRSEAEIRKKFAEYSGQMLDDVIEYLKENEYIDDNEYIEKSIQEFQRLKKMSIKELEYKLLAKGLDKDKIDNYVFSNREELLEYELNSARTLFQKKQVTMEKEEILKYLRNKGYLSEVIKIVQEEDRENE